MARRRDGSAQPDLFSLLDAEGGGEQPGDRSDRDRLYSHHLALPSEWTPARRQEFIETESARISRRVAELAAGMSEQAVVDWTARHGDHPDFMTKVGLLNTASASAKEMVLAQQPAASRSDHSRRT